MSHKILELYGHYARTNQHVDWTAVVAAQHCPFLDKKCIKVRKSRPDISIGTCAVEYGRDEKALVICPHRLLERKQIFTDCLHLLTSHEPGNELHVLAEKSVPGGSVDYFLVSAKNRKVMDFVGIELQTLDTTGTVWPERQRFLHEHGIKVAKRDRESKKKYGMNWKMTAKTILVQLHHKVETFEAINKHLALVSQDYLLEYMRDAFSFGHLNDPAVLGNPMQFHAYTLKATSAALRLELTNRFSTDTAGIAACLGLQVSAKVELERIIGNLESELSEETLLALQ